MSALFDVLIVGGGHAGAQAAIALRQLGFAGSIALVTDDAYPPYERPPLSKEYLAGEKPLDRILIRPESFWSDKAIILIRGKRIVSIDPQASTAVSGAGETYGYGDLIWAAGGHARRLSCQGGDLAGVHSVRSVTDVDKLVEELPTAQNVVVIGGGYIGLETAAVLSKAGKCVTILEAQDRVLARVAGEPLSLFFQAEHRDHGVEIRLNTVVDGIEGKEGRVAAVRLADGETLAADLVIVGIGIVPQVDALAAAGALCDNGVNIDAFCRTSLPHVYAIGDCALHLNAFAGESIRLESVQNAHDQAVTAAHTIMGTPKAYVSAPWFWSNQFDLRLQTVGISRGFDQAVVRGQPSSRSFSVVYLREGRVIALDCVNAAKDFVQGKALVINKVAASLEVLQNPDHPLKDLANAQRATLCVST